MVTLENNEVVAKSTSLAIDIGGTFTDVVLIAGGKVTTDKTLTTHHDLLEGLFRGVGEVLRKAGVPPSAIDGSLVHATTVVTNALIERKGAKSAMLYTEGFADILEIREERRFDIYDTQIRYAEPLVPSSSSYAVKERTLASGHVEKAPNSAEIERLVARLRRGGIESVGVCFLHSYRNPANERAVGDLLRELAPEIQVSLSSEVAPQIREYLRASTTAVNTYAVTITRPYLGRLKERLCADGFAARPLIMLSSGGVVSPETAGRLPVRMIESGPAAGALGAAHFARELGEPEVLAFDMGGTTAKVCLIQDGEPLVSNMFEVDRIYRLKEGSGIPVLIPSVDLIEIGAGGGSIGHVDQFGLLKVGPESAGSSPGPVCYGGGGTQPTVTDAAVVLGLLDPDSFLGGDMKLDGAAAKLAMAELGKSLDLDAETCARGVFEIVCEAMAGAVRAHAAERGVDVRGVPLLAFGGSGPVHACGVADLLHADRIIFPPHASVLSAFGSIITPARFDVVRSGLVRLDAFDWSAIEALLTDMESEGRAALAEAQVAADDLRFVYAADVRYVGQHHELKVDLPERPSAEAGAPPIRAAFEQEYARRHAIVQKDVPVEIVSWRLAAVGPGGGGADFSHSAGAAARPAKVRRVHAWGEGREVAVHQRLALAPGDRIEGPAIIEERETTLVIAPEWAAEAGPLGCIIAARRR